MIATVTPSSEVGKFGLVTLLTPPAKSLAIMVNRPPGAAAAGRNVAALKMFAVISGGGGPLTSSVQLTVAIVDPSVEVAVILPLYEPGARPVGSA